MARGGLNLIFLGCNLDFLAIVGGDSRLGSNTRKYGILHIKMNDHQESSFLAYLIRIGLRNDLGGVFS